MRKRNGFTLVELLVTISLLAVLGTIIIYNTVALSEDTKELQYDRMKEVVEDATRTYVNLYPEKFSQLYTYKAFDYIKLGDVIDSGLLDEDTENPFTKEKVSRDEDIKVYVDGDTKELVFIYPVTDEDRNSEIWLSTGTITTEIPKGETNALVDLYKGISKTKADLSLALSNEQGFIIEDYAAHGYDNMMTYYKEYYKFKVVDNLIPKAFTQCQDKGIGKKLRCWTGGVSDYGLFENTGTEDYYYVSKGGNYYITYEWYIPGTNTRRTKTRLVRVIDSNASQASEKGEINNNEDDDDDDVIQNNTVPVDQKDGIKQYDLEEKSTLPKRFQTLQGNYLDTEVKLMEADRNYSIIMTARMESAAGTSNNGMQFFHSMKEVTPYSGLTFRDVGDGTSVCPRYKYLGGIGLCSSLSCTTMCVQKDTTWKLVLYRDIDNPTEVTYAYCGNYNPTTKKCNSDLKQGFIKYVYEYYDKTLILGAGYKTDGKTLFRYMDATVYEFKVYFGYNQAKSDIAEMEKTYKEAQEK